MKSDAYILNDNKIIANKAKVLTEENIEFSI